MYPGFSFGADIFLFLFSFFLLFDLTLGGRSCFELLRLKLGDGE